MGQDALSESMRTVAFLDCCHVALQGAVLRLLEPSIAIGETTVWRSLGPGISWPRGQKPHQVRHKKPGFLGPESLRPLGHMSQLCDQSWPGPSPCSWVSGSRGCLEGTKLLTTPHHSSPATFSPFLSTPAHARPRVFVYPNSFC